MSGEGLTAVGQLNTISLGKGGGGDTPTPPPPTPRTISWTLKPVWSVGEVIVATDIAVSAGPANAVQTAPAQIKQTKGGVTVEVVAEAPAAGGFAFATKKESVTVNKIKPTIVWKTPLPVKKGTKLSATQQDAKITPDGLALVYKPAPKTAMNTVREETLTVGFIGDDGHEKADASVTLTVVDNDSDLATATGRIGMESGRAFNFRTTPEVLGALDNWKNSDLNDPLSMQVQGKKIMADLQTMTPKELIKYMDGLIKDKDKQFKLNDRNKNNNLKLYPNLIWILPNGLQVRYKPNGDGQDGRTDPMFCVEGRRTDKPGFGEEPEDSAFKLMSNGEPAPVGPKEVSLPSFASGPNDDDGKNLDRQAMSGAMKTTHLYCPPMQDQVITWAGPGTLDAGTALSNTHLNATALGGITPTYVEGSSAVTAGQVLAAGVHTLHAVTVETDRYKAGKSVPVTITMQLKGQDLKYTGPTELSSNSTLNESLVSVLDKAAISFELAGQAVVSGEPLRQGKGSLIVRAAPTALYAAAEVTVEVTVRKPEWEIAWDNPGEIVEGEKLTGSAHLNASVTGGTTELVYADEEGNTIKAGDTLAILDRGDDEDTSEGQTQDLTVTAKASKFFSSSSKTVQILVKPKPKAKPTANTTNKKPGSSNRRKK